LGAKPCKSNPEIVDLTALEKIVKASNKFIDIIKASLARILCINLQLHLLG